MKEIAFSNEKYVEMQSAKIRERISKFDGKLYLEFGGKLFDDFHAARVLPGFSPDNKIKLLLEFKDICEMLVCINASDIEKNKIRDKINIATKLPHYLIKSRDGAEKTFNEELKRLRTTWVDYYLMHMLTDVKTWNRLVQIGIKDWIEEKKKNGQIKQIGFSYHGNSEEFCKLIDAYDWDFCMIQYNYLDEFEIDE